MAKENPLSWHSIAREVFRRKDVKLVTYVPDKVLSPLIASLSDDPDFRCFATAREEEAVGVIAGAWLAGARGVLLMQTSGFATLANVLASLAVPYQIPIPMMISERGTLGEFNLVQALPFRTMRPILDSIGIDHFTATRADEFEFALDRSLDQAFATLNSTAIILSPLLTGGKIEQGARR